MGWVSHVPFAKPVYSIHTVDVQILQQVGEGQLTNGQLRVDWLMFIRPFGKSLVEVVRICGRSLVPVWSNISDNVVT